jgi:hypothetical protein
MGRLIPNASSGFVLLLSIEMLPPTLQKYSGPSASSSRVLHTVILKRLPLKNFVSSVPRFTHSDNMQNGLYVCRVNTVKHIFGIVAGGDVVTSQVDIIITQQHICVLSSPDRDPSFNLSRQSTASRICAPTPSSLQAHKQSYSMRVLAAAVTSIPRCRRCP